MCGAISAEENQEAELWWTLALSEAGSGHKTLEQGNEQSREPGRVQLACVIAEMPKEVSQTRQREQPSSRGHVNGRVQRTYHGRRQLLKVAEEGGKHSF